jgi:trk system potassium uptake protein
MRILSVLYVLGLLMLFLGLALLVPLLTSLYYGESDWYAFAMTIVLSEAIGYALWFRGRGSKELRVKEGFAVVTFGWITLSLVGMLPFIFSGAIPSVTDAFFETVSGFTTTGATILTDIEPLPHGLLLWRSLTHWLGGMGFIVLSLAILPLLGVGGMQLYKAEMPGLSKDKLTPRIAGTAKALWGVYVLLSLAEAVLLVIGGMPIFDAVNHTMATMATGGFSTKNASVGFYGNDFTEWVIIVFMFLAGINFSLHFRVLRGDIWTYFRDREFQFYLGAMLVVSAILAIDVRMHYETSTADAVRDAVFQTVAIGTTTGFGTADYDSWSTISRMSLLVLMFFGGMAGSTGGGMKIVRIMLLLKNGVVELVKSLHPNAVIPIRIGKLIVSSDVMSRILGFFLIYISIFVITALIMAMLGLDMVSAIGAAAASVGNIGPGFGSVGPTMNYADIPALGKWVLSFAMLMGRLELYTVLVLLTPDIWKA